MASNTSSTEQKTPKRPNEEPAIDEDKTKRVKPETRQEDPSWEGLFEPLPFETKDGLKSSDFPLEEASDFELPDFLSDNTGAPPSRQELTAPSIPTQRTDENAMHSSELSQEAAPKGPGADSSSTAQFPSELSRSNSGMRLTENNTQQGNSAIRNQLQHSQSHQNISSAYAYQKPPGTYPSQFRSAQQNPVPSPSTQKAGIRFDPKRTYTVPHTLSAPSISLPNAQPGPNYGSSQSNSQDKSKPEDPSKLNDALAAAGVDIQREEELLSTNYNRSAVNLYQQQIMNRQRQANGQMNAFLHPYHAALFMNRTARENGVMQNFISDPEILELMSSACKEWISNIVTKTVALAKHRRRGIPAFNPKLKLAGKHKNIPLSQHSEVSKELRALALRQKELEERRVAKRALLGLEKSEVVAPDSANKAGAEETLHRAANATAAMMTSNASRKKYSWMTSGAGGSGEEAKTGSAKDSASKQNYLISARGDNGLRFREIRTGNTITSKDLLGVLEDERIGTSKALMKGYARLKD